MDGHHATIEEAGAAVRVERIGRTSRRSVAVIGLTVGLIAVAITKPWGPAAPAWRDDPAHWLATAGPVFEQPAAPTPSDDPEVVAAQRRAQCYASPEWRLVTMEVTALGDSRTMYGAAAAEASGPADPSIPTAHLAAIRLYGIGLCRPSYSSRPTTANPLEHLTLWLIRAGDRPLRVTHVSIIDQGLFRLGEEYFGPPPSEQDPIPAARVPRAWQPGRYVFKIDRGGEGSHPLWLALDFSTPQPAAARPAG